MKGKTCFAYLLETYRENTAKLAGVQEQKRKAEENLKAARKEIDEIRSSTTFRVGRIVTAIPRKIKCLLKGEKNA